MLACGDGVEFLGIEKIMSEYHPPRPSPDIIWQSSCCRDPALGCLVLAVLVTVFSPLILAAVLVAIGMFAELFKIPIG